MLFAAGCDKPRANKNKNIQRPKLLKKYEDSTFSYGFSHKYEKNVTKSVFHRITQQRTHSGSSQVSKLI